MAASACSTTIPAQPTHGALDLSRALPQPSPSPFGLSGGHRQPGLTGKARDSGAELQARAMGRPVTPDGAERARPSAAHARAPAVPTNPQALPGSIGGQPSAAPPPAGDFGIKPTAERTAAAPKPSAISDSQRYAQRESQARNQERFRGGDLVIIGVSTLLVVLLVVLLIVLLI